MIIAGEGSVHKLGGCKVTLELLYDSLGCIFLDSGLPCVCILIGVFLKSTGQPIAGVVNQPFHQENNERLIFGTRPSFDQFSKWSLTGFRWSGRRLWGLRHGDVSMNNITSQLTSDAEQTLTMSSSEGMKIREKLRGNFQLMNASGAGYKMLCVVDG